MVIILQFVDVEYHIDRFVDIEESLHPWNKSYLTLLNKGSIQEEEIRIVNIYAPNIRSPQYIRQLFTAIKGRIYSKKIVVGDFNTPLTLKERSSNQRINEETLALKDTLDQIDLTDIYRILHPKATEYRFLSSAHGTFSRIDYILGHRSSLGKLKNNWNYPMHFLQPQFYGTRNQLQGKRKKKKAKNTNSWKISSMILNNKWIIEEIKEEIKR